MQEQLQDKYSVLDSTFETRIDFRGYDKFWSSFGKELLRINKAFNLPSINSAGDFVDMFTLENQKLIFKGRPVVLFIDEFDKLYTAKTEVIDSVLGALRGMKQHRSNYCLHSMVGIGPFSILQLSSRSSSPFNVRHAVQSPYWTHEEVTCLFREFEDECGLKLDARIIDDVFTRTGGHSGLVCLCGKAMDEVLLKDKAEITYETWIRYATFSLAGDMDRWPTMMKLSDTLSEENAEMEQCVDFLFRTFLKVDGNLEISRLYDVKERRFCQFLTSEGALRHNGGDYFSVPSPLIKSLLFDRVVRRIKGRPVPKIPVPYDDEGLLKVGSILKTSLQHFDRNFVRDSMRSSFKMVSNKKVPQEAAYHPELHRILGSWLLRDVGVISEHNITGRKRCDILLVPSPDQRILIEIVVSETVQSVEEHLLRAREYADILEAKECWVLHITTDPSFNCPVPDPSLGIIGAGRLP
jgi:hypothetical protein